MATIATVCTDQRAGTELVDMAAIRWYEISRALADLGHSVDIVHGRYKWRFRQPTHELGPGLREVPISRVRWHEYDVVKTLFHRGFETLERFGGAGHPFVISKLGSVVGPEDRDGIYFYGTQREALFEVQERIQRTSRYVTLLTESARELWSECHGDRGNLLVVPGAAPRDIPPGREDPYPLPRRPRVVFAGNFYSTEKLSQPEAHRTLTEKLNVLGALLAERGIDLFVIGPGEVESLDPAVVKHLGVIPYDQSWAYLRHADVGLVVSAGPFMHNNESTKLYYYLRVGLPVVSEWGFPNDDLIRDTGHGRLVEPGDTTGLLDAIREVLSARWERRSAIDFILERHTWSVRARTYDRLLRLESSRE